MLLSNFRTAFVSMLFLITITPFLCAVAFQGLQLMIKLKVALTHKHIHPDPDIQRNLLFFSELYFWITEQRLA